MRDKPNPTHIEGIYNYCDRWCERCSFTSRCAVFEQANDVAPGQNDIENKAFWERLAKNFADAIALLHEAAKEQGIDLEAISDEEWEVYKKQQKAGRAKINEHPLIKLSKEYSLQARDLLQKNEALKQKGKEILLHTELGILDISDAKNELLDLTDCLEVVQWYVFQIQVKFMRALPMMPGEVDDEAFTDDSNGSAKVALIAVDRCMNAWQKIAQISPAAEDEIIPLLALLQKIRRIGEETFPGARKFIRVGLDE